MKNKKIIFIGLGVMGYPIAGHISNAGYNITVYNRTVSKAESWSSEYGGKYVESLDDIVEDADMIITCLGNDQDLESLFFENKMIERLKEGVMILDHTTSSVQIAQKIALNLEEKNGQFLDAPLSGGGNGAVKGILSVMVGGDKYSLDKIKELLNLYSSKVNFMGFVGSGQLTKMANQICISANLQGVAEAISFAQNSGLDVNKVLSVLSGGAAQSWQLENRGPWMLDKSYKNGGFSVELIKKDLGLVLEESSQNNTKLPVTKLNNEFFKSLIQEGKGDWDFSTIIELLK